MTPEDELLDFNDYPRIEVAGVADAYLIGPNRACFVLYDWTKVRGVLRKKVSCEIRRSLYGLREEQASFWRTIYRAGCDAEGVALIH